MLSRLHGKESKAFSGATMQGRNDHRKLLSLKNPNTTILHTRLSITGRALKKC